MSGVISGLVFNQQFWGPPKCPFCAFSVISEHHHVEGEKPASTSTNGEKSGLLLNMSQRKRGGQI